MNADRTSGLPGAQTGHGRVLAVVAHPDDESFGLGAVIDHYGSAGAVCSVLCFTHGEASTLHADDPDVPDGIGGTPRDLGRIRADELAAAGAVLQIDRTELLDYPDGELDRTGVAELAGHVRRVVRETASTHLLVFDVGGITGHPDHVHATRAALAAARDLDLTVVAWALPEAVANELNGGFGTGFAGRAADGRLISLTVDRDRQRKAIECHRSQSGDNPVLYRRLGLLGGTEHLVVLRREGDPASAPA